MDFTQDHFTLLGLPRRFAVDGAALEQRYRELQAEVHPDRHAHLSESEQRLAMQRSTLVNGAYQTLRQPLKRAEYLLSLHGVDVHAERHMVPDFLMQQMEWREAVAEARAARDEAALEALLADIRKEIRAEYQRLEAQLDAANWPAAAALARQLMFEEKLLQEVGEALAILEDA